MMRPLLFSILFSLSALAADPQIIDLRCGGTAKLGEFPVMVLESKLSFMIAGPLRHVYFSAEVANEGFRRTLNHERSFAPADKFFAPQENVFVSDLTEFVFENLQKVGARLVSSQNVDNLKNGAKVLLQYGPKVDDLGEQSWTEEYRLECKLGQ